MPRPHPDHRQQRSHQEQPLPLVGGGTMVSTSPNGDVVSMVSGANRIAYRYDDEHRLGEA